LGSLLLGGELEVGDGVEEAEGELELEVLMAMREIPSPSRRNPVFCSNLNDFGSPVPLDSPTSTSGKFP